MTVIDVLNVTADAEPLEVNSQSGIRSFVRVRTEFFCGQ